MVASDPGGPLVVLPGLFIPEEEIEETFMASPGPGGQNVNRVATAVRLHFDVRRSPSLAPAIKARLERLAGRRLRADGVLVVRAHTHRTREQNRREARRRLVDLIRKAATPPAKRHPTRPTASSRRARLTAKKVRGRLKQERRRRDQED
jgi:ribosome-associated protein